MGRQVIAGDIAENVGRRLPAQSRTAGPARHDGSVQAGRAIGNHALSGVLRAKLAIGPPGDPYEQEADRVAERITKAPDPAPLRRKPNEEEDELRMKPEPVVMRQPQGEQSQGTYAPPVVHDVLARSGQPLDTDVRAFMEPRFGYDFGHVRIHTDRDAATSARVVGAHAYTVGEKIVFGEGRYRPATADGRSLLAHELTHVVQGNHAPPLGAERRPAGSSFGAPPVLRRVYRDPRTHTITASEAVMMTTDELDQAIAQAEAALEEFNASTPETDGLTANLDVLQRERTTRMFPGPLPQAPASPAPAGPSPVAASGTGATLNSTSESGLRSSMEGGASVQKMGIVQVDDGADLYTAPSTKGTPTARLPLNTRLFVDRATGSGWYFVVLENGGVGYIDVTHVNTALPEPGARLHRIKGGEYALAIVKQYYKGGAIEWGQDERFYVNVLVLVNAEAQRNGIYRERGNDDWDQTKTREGRQIWIPSLAFAQSLKGKVASGSLSYDVYTTLRDAAIAVGEFILGTGAFVAGLLHGALESLWDLLVGLVDLLDMAWSIVKSLLSGEILNDAGKLMSELASLDLAALVEMGLDSIAKKWNDPDLLTRWHYRGWLIGYIIMELLMLFFSDGLLTAVKWVGKSATVAKILAKLPKLAKIVDAAKLMKGEKVLQLRDALKGERLAKAAKAAETAFKWARETMKIPADIVRQFTVEMVEALKGIPKWAQEEIAAMSDLAKRGLFCNSPCSVKMRALWQRVEKIVEIRGVMVRGFNNAGELVERVGNLRNRIKKTGLEDVVIGLRGSSVTGISSKGGEFRWLAEGMKASDVDFFFTSKTLEAKLKKLGAHFKPDGRLDPSVLAKYEPKIAEELAAFAAQSETQLGRKANAILLTESLAASLKPLEHIIF